MTDDQTLGVLRAEVAGLSARFEERTNSIIRMIEEDREAREALSKRLDPVIKSVDQWKGGLATVALGAGAIGATITAAVKHWLNGSSP